MYTSIFWSKLKAFVLWRKYLNAKLWLLFWCQRFPLHTIISFTGSIREAGGAFGKMEAAREEQWARELQAEQLKHLHEHHHEEIAHHKAAIDRHKEAIKRHEQKIKLFSKDH